MKKKITAVLAAVSILTANSFAAVTSIDNEYEVDVTTVTVSGNATKGDFLGYTVIKSTDDASDPAKVVATGDKTVTESDGKFTIDFTLPEDTATGDYKVRIGWLGGSETKIKEIHFVNVSNTVKALQDATALSDLETIFVPDPTHSEALTQLGFDFVSLNSVISSTGRTKVLTSFLNNAERPVSGAAALVEMFNKYLGLQLINENKPGGVEKVNPTFGSPAVQFNDLTDTALKDFITDGIYLKDEYENVDAVKTACAKLNILYLINNSETGEIPALLELYKNDLELVGKDYYNTYLGMSSINKSRVIANYVGYLEKTDVNSVEAFLELFEKAVEAAANSGGNSSGGSGGGGGSSFSPSGGTSPYVPYNPTPGIVSTNVGKDQKFSDIADFGWAKEAINALADKGIINGVAPGKFEPESNVTREQIVKMILLSIGIEGKAADCPFADVNQSEWYAPFVAEGYRQGIINGISDDRFGTGESLTRQDLAVIAVRAAKNKGIINVENARSASFDDRKGIADYAVEAVDILYSLGVINGKGGNLFAPNDYCTRAEAAKIIYSIFFR